MTEETVTDAAIRRFLLGDVDDAERQRIERLFISDPVARDKILLAEDDLIEEYLEDSLTPSDREKVLACYRSTPQQRRKLRLAKSIREYAVGETVQQQRTQEVTPMRPRWRLLGVWRSQKRLVLIPAAVALAIAIVFSVIWLNRRTQENSRRQAIERELVELNTALTIRKVPPPVLSIMLAPVSVRSVEPPPELKQTTNAGIIELHLLSMRKDESPSYQAVLRRVGNSEQFTIPGLHLEKRPEGNAVRVRLPAHILTRGLYQIDLTGVRAEGQPDESEEYTFMVGG